MNSPRPRPFGAATPAVIALAGAAVVVLALGIWLALPRFRLDGVALIDDWWWVGVVAPQSLGETLMHFFVDFHIAPTGRFNPGSYWASYFQWHLTGAPESVDGSHLVGEFRRVLFMELITILPAALVWTQRDRPIAPGWIFGLALIPPLVVVGCPQLGPEIFARGTVGEPTMVSEILAGGVMIILALKRWLRRGERFRREDALTVAVLALGLLLIFVGVLSKESNISFLLLAPFVYLYLDRRWREAGVIDRPLHSYTPFRVVTVLFLLPFARLTIGTLYALALGVGDAPYGSTTTSDATALGRIGDYFSIGWDTQRTTVLAALALLIAVGALLLVDRNRRGRLPLIETGFVLTAIVSLLLQTFGFDAAPRYLLPSIVLLATAGVMLLARFGPALRAAAIVAAAIFSFANLDYTRDLVEGWTLRLEQGEEALRELRPYDAAHCPVYMGSITGAEAMSIPVLLQLDYGPAPKPCRAEYAGVLLSGPDTGSVSYMNEAIHKVCAGKDWQPLWTNTAFTISGCDSFRDGTLPGGQRVVEVLGEDRIILGHSFLPEGRMKTRVDPPS